LYDLLVQRGQKGRAVGTLTMPAFFAAALALISPAATLGCSRGKSRAKRSSFS
jgi:hypothetical protein